MAKFTPAPEVKEIAEELIPLHHSHLVDARIEYVFTDTVGKRGSKQVWGTMRKISALPAYLAADKNSQNHGETDDFFVLTITKPIWEDLSYKQRVALVDHELCHAGVKLDDEGEAKLFIVPHDLEEFTCIVKRHGLWREDVKKFFNSKDEPEGQDDHDESEE